MNKKESKQVKRLILIIVLSVFLIFTGLAIELISASFKHSKNTENSDNSQNIGFATESAAQVESVTEEESLYPMYIDNKDMITSQVLGAMKTQGEDALRAEIADIWVNVPKEEVSNNKLYCQIEISQPNIEYVGYYFQHGKDFNSVGIKNRIYMIYKVEQTLNQLWTDHGNENRDQWQAYSGVASYYAFVTFEQLQMVDSSTATVDVTKYYKTDRGFNIEYSTGVTQGFGVDAVPWAFVGFKDFMTFENKYIVPEMDKYAYETELDESKFIKNEDLGVVEKDHTDYLNSVQFER